MNITAAILWEQGRPLSIEAATLDAPGPGEVLIEVKASGVCHSDLHPARGDWPTKTPVVLGHEGAGIVRHTGPDVTRVRSGDHVVFCWAPSCGTCPPCLEGRAVLCDRLEKTTYRNKLPSGAARLHAQGHHVAPFLGTACFADHVVLAEEAAIPVPCDVPFDALATLGCAVVTGVGAVSTAARVSPGARVAIIGAGGVGLNVVQGASIAKCEQIIAIDRRQAPLALARTFGATDTVDASGTVPDAARADRRSRCRLRVRHGRLPRHARRRHRVGPQGRHRRADGPLARRREGAVAMFPFVMQEKRLMGSVYGSGRPAADITRLLSLYQEGWLKLRELVTRTYALDEVNEALAALAGGDGARGIIRW